MAKTLFTKEAFCTADKDFNERNAVYVDATVDVVKAWLKEQEPDLVFIEKANIELAISDLQQWMGSCGGEDADTIHIIDLLNKAITQEQS